MLSDPIPLATRFIFLTHTIIHLWPSWRWRRVLWKPGFVISVGTGGRPQHLGLSLSNNSVNHWSWLLRKTTFYSSPDHQQKRFRIQKWTRRERLSVMTLLQYEFKGNFFPFKTMKKFMLLPEISFKPSVVFLKTALLRFSEELCVRAKAGYFDNPWKTRGPIF